LTICLTLRRAFAGACITLVALCCPARIHAQQASSARKLDQSAYLHYLLSLRYATDGVPEAALHEAATSLRLQAEHNPSAGLAFHLITQQRQDTHIHLCCFQANVIAAQYSPDGTRILSTLDDKTLRIWDAATGSALFAPMQHADAILAAVWSADGKRIVSSSRDGKVHLWNAETGKPAREPFQSEHPITHLALSPNGETVLSSQQTYVYVWKTANGEVVSPKPYHDDITALAFSDDGKYALIATNDDTADIVDPVTAKRVHRLAVGNGVFHASFSKDSRFALTASEDRTAQIWDANTGTAHGAAFKHAAAVADAVFSNDGKLVLTTSFDHTARVWNAVTGQAVTASLIHSTPVSAGGFSADGALALTQARDGAVRIWDVATGEVVDTPIHVTGKNSIAAFSPVESKLLLASDQSVEILDEVPSEQPPSWLADLADFEGSRSRFDVSPVQNRAAIEKLRQAILDSKDTDHWTQFAKWYFASPQERTVSPWSSISLQSYVENLLLINTQQSLSYAEKTSAGNPALLVRIAEAKKKLGGIK